jgi:ankyrin repeat protein
VDTIQQLYRAVARAENKRVHEIVSGHPDLARAKNDEGLPVLVFARYMGNADAFSTLVDAGPPLDVFEAAQVDDVARLQALLDEDRALANSYSADGFTALHFAAYYDAPGAMRLLLDRGAATGAVTKNFLANMPVHAAAAAAVGHVQACTILLDAGAQVNARQHGENTPLHTAAFRGDRELAELLLARGADPAATNADGQTAAAIARSHGASQLAALLRAHEN